MKHLILLGFIALSLVSCRKCRTCQLQIKTDVNPTTTTNPLISVQEFEACGEYWKKIDGMESSYIMNPSPNVKMTVTRSVICY
jgi:hypothetical protein